jgi:type I restriction enzyme R subunit
MNTLSFKEDHISQIPAIEFLVKLGYKYLSHDEVFRLRNLKYTNVILDEILTEQLRKINKIKYKGKEYPFSESNIIGAAEALKNHSLNDGLIRTNENIYDLLTLGKSFEQIIEGDKKSFNIKYIDWDNHKNNVYHIAEEYDVQREHSEHLYRPDIILFINGIPLVVIECKRPDMKDSLQEAISQHLRNQHEGGIQKLFIFSQLLLALNENEAKYGTTGTQLKFWATWKEFFQTEKKKHEYEGKLNELKNKKLSEQEKDKIFSGRFKYIRSYFDALESQEQLVTEQDRLLFNLCSPERLIELIYKFIVYDTGEKKIARYQQYFTVKNIIQKIRFKEKGKRTGGVVWHTQGSGKSITMVMLAKSIALEKTIRNPRIILVTDRIDLDDQIYRTFKSCGKEVTQAKSGKHLMNLIKDSKEVIVTTLIDKFEAAANIRNFRNESSEIFVLIDEAHRNQYGFGNTRMRNVLPNACFIGFTGTPIMKKDKDTISKFGGLIKPVYTIETAEMDKAVVPLIHEGRHVIQEVDKKPLDTYFELVCKTLTENEKADLKKKFASTDHLNEAEQKIYRIAWDISMHYKNEWQGTGFKAQLVTPSKKAAIKYKHYMDEIGYVTSEVLISPPDQREAYEDIYDITNEQLISFWKKMMTRFGNEQTYNKQLINAFKNDDEPEIIIVVDKLLTGFDAPRNTVLYIARNLVGHNLLQAIARVNRLYEGKDAGYLIDYYGILGNLDQALTSYKALAEFDEEDLENTITSVTKEIEKLPEVYSQLWDIFKTIQNKRDLESYEQLLADNALREDFYIRVLNYVKILKTALSTLQFAEKTPQETIDKYRNDAKMFLCLRSSVQKRYSDKIEYKQYEAQIQRLIDTHITSSEIIKITDPVNIFETERFQEELEKAIGQAAKADMIASRTQKTITEKMDEDPVFYKKFSEILEQVIAEFRARRISDAEYLNKAKDIMNSVINRIGDEIPPELEGKNIAKAYYGICLEILDNYKDSGIDPKQLAAECGIKIDEIISSNMVIDFHSNITKQNIIRQIIDDYLYSIIDKHNLNITIEQQDAIIERSIEVAKHRY